MDIINFICWVLSAYMFGFFNGSYTKNDEVNIEKELFVVIELEKERFFAYEIRSTKFLADAKTVEELVLKLEQEYSNHIIYYA
jgi:hypothetical protein